VVGSLVRYRHLIDIVGDVIRVRARDVAMGDLAIVHNVAGDSRGARIIELNGDVVTLQVTGGSRGLSTDASVQFLGYAPMATCSANILGRVFSGSGTPIDGGPTLQHDRRIPVQVPPVNPVMRIVPSRIIHTDVPMIDLFNTLVESQKIPIFSVPGEPYNALLARIGFQTDADIVVFGGLGLPYDEYHYFHATFQDRGVFHRTVMFVNLAADPLVERLLVPDLALAVAERFAIEEHKRVLVLLTDMTSYVDAQKEIGIAMERIPSNRGYLGDLYTQLARRYEKACNFKDGGSVTILSVTTMPGNDVTHPIPDNTGYITEGQLYLHNGVIDPFGSLSRLKQHVVGAATREDHEQVASTMVRLFAGAEEAERKRAMAFTLSPYDERLLRFGALFRERFMRLEVSMPITRALDLCWTTLAECFMPQELLIKQALIDEYYPSVAPQGAPAPLR
jgi:V/A-type H+-transporting ATPase subunit B